MTDEVETHGDDDSIRDEDTEGRGGDKRGKRWGWRRTKNKLQRGAQDRQQNQENVLQTRSRQELGAS